MWFYAKLGVVLSVLAATVLAVVYNVKVQNELRMVNEENKTWVICSDEIWQVTTDRLAQYKDCTTRPSVQSVFNQAYSEHLKVCKRSHLTEQILKREFGVDHFATPTPECPNRK